MPVDVAVANERLAMSNACRICQRYIRRWHNARFHDAPAVEGFWAEFCLPCRIRCRLNAYWYLLGY